MNKILLSGGSGVLGSALVRELQTRQLDFLVGSRHPVNPGTYDTVTPIPAARWRPLDLATGTGLREALDGTDTVIQLASNMGKVGQEPFEIVAMRHLLAAARQSGVRHLVYISIVGVDKIPFGYYQAKRKAEVLLQQSGLPYTILRATQFYPFVNAVLGKLLRWPIGALPKSVKLQPIAVTTVAQRLLELVQQSPQQGIVQLAGPEVADLGTLARQWQQQHPMRRLVLPLPIVGAWLKSLARGEATAPAAAALDSPTWADYLKQQP